ncbi:deaminase [Streptomyces zaomyceticus]|uniref:deaminase n=1 Tax=Streptomyces zaomyceticus TaxID=68286 RepID=UPI0036C11D9C
MTIRRSHTVAKIDLAIKQALLSDCRQRVGAVLVAGGRVLAASPNLRRNDPAVDYRHATFHAEEAVLRRAVRAAGAVLYVARVSAAGEPAMAKPCERCELIIIAAGVRRAFYTLNSRGLGRITPTR